MRGGIGGVSTRVAWEWVGEGMRAEWICTRAVEGVRKDGVVGEGASARGGDEQVVGDDYVSAVSLKTWVTADDITNMVHFLDSPAGVKISGQSLAVDGHTESIS